MKISKKNIHLFGTEKQSLISELLKLGATLSTIDGTEIIEIDAKNKSLWIGSYLPTVPYSIGMCLTNRNYIKEVLKINKIQTPNAVFIYPGQKNITELVELIEYPVVLRQENTLLDVSPIKNIQTKDELLSAIVTMSKHGQGMLVEKQVTGNEYRVFYTRSGAIQVLKKNKGGTRIFPASELALNFQDNSDYLAEKDIHPSWVALFERILSAFTPVEYLSFSLICDSISNSSKNQKVSVLGVSHSAYTHYSFPLFYLNKKSFLPANRTVVQEIARILFKR